MNTRFHPQDSQRALALKISGLGQFLDPDLMGSSTWSSRWIKHCFVRD